MKYYLAPTPSIYSISIWYQVRMLKYLWSALFCVWNLGNCMGHGMGLFSKFYYYKILIAFESNDSFEDWYFSVWRSLPATQWNNIHIHIPHYLKISGLYATNNSLISQIFILDKHYSRWISFVPKLIDLYSDGASTIRIFSDNSVLSEINHLTFQDIN